MKLDSLSVNLYFSKKYWLHGNIIYKGLVKATGRYLRCILFLILFNYWRLNIIQANKCWSLIIGQWWRQVKWAIKYVELLGCHKRYTLQFSLATVMTKWWWQLWRCYCCSYYYHLQHTHIYCIYTDRN